LAVPMEVVGLVAWKIERALLRDLRLEILLVSLVCFNSSEGFRVMMMILMSKAKMAITINSSIRVKDLFFFNCLMNLNMISLMTRSQVRNQNKYPMNKATKRFEN
jgi:hypothetical protein